MYNNKRAQFFLLAAVIISLVVISLGATTNRIVTQEGNFQSIDDFSYQVKKETGEVLNYEIYSGISDGKVEEFARLMAEDIQDKDPDTEFVFVFGNNEDLAISNYGEDDVDVVNTDLVNAIYCRYTFRGLLDELNNDPTERCGDEDNCYACNPELTIPNDACPLSTYIPTPVGVTIIGNYFDFACTNDWDSVDGVVTGYTCTNLGGVGETCTEERSEEPETIHLTSDELESGMVTVTIDGVDVVIPVSEYRQVQLIVKRDSDNETYIDY